MSFYYDKQCLIAISCLALIGCSGNSGTANSNATQSFSLSGIQLQDAETQVTSGIPGQTVDCQQSLPCRWTSSDAHFSLTVTNADNVATRSRLAINYTVSTTHDTRLLISDTDDALDANGLRLAAAEQVLGDGGGSGLQETLAGATVAGTTNFETSTTSNSIAQWSLGLLDGGNLRKPSFTNLPVGSITTFQKDCQFSLPCVWTTPQHNVAITVQSLGSVTQEGELSAKFVIETSANIPVAVSAGSMAEGIDGTLFESRNHELVAQTDSEKLTALSDRDIPLHAAVNFYRTVQIPAGIALLSLVVYQDEPVPRWNPQFINLPVQLP